MAFPSPSPQFPFFEQFIKPDQSGKGNEQLYPAHPIQLYNIIKQEKRDLPRRKISCKIHSTSLSLSLSILKNLFISDTSVPNQGSRKVLLSPLIPFRVGDFTIANEIPSVKTLGPCLEHGERERGEEEIHAHTYITWPPNNGSWRLDGADKSVPRWARRYRKQVYRYTDLLSPRLLSPRHSSLRLVYTHTHTLL